MMIIFRILLYLTLVFTYQVTPWVLTFSGFTYLAAECGDRKIDVQNVHTLCKCQFVSVISPRYIHCVHSNAQSNRFIIYICIYIFMRSRRPHSTIHRNLLLRTVVRTATANVLPAPPSGAA